MAAVLAAATALLALPASAGDDPGFHTANTAMVAGVTAQRCRRSSLSDTVGDYMFERS